MRRSMVKEMLTELEDAGRTGRECEDCSEKHADASRS